MTWKYSSTSAFQAFFPINRHKQWMYWHPTYLYGIVDIRRADLLNLDEWGIFVETADKHIGKTCIENRVRKADNYHKSEKWNLLLTISGSVAAERWVEMWPEDSTTSLKMVEFILIVLADIGPGTPLQHR